MGYDFHITRAKNWASNEGNRITAQEWLEVINEDPELIPSPEHGEYFVIWRGTTQYPETWFDWQDGNIGTKNPDKATLRKLSRIAQRLGAKIEGDEGEIWGEQEIDIFADPENDAVKIVDKKANTGFLARIRQFLKIT